MAFFRGFKNFLPVFAPFLLTLSEEYANLFASQLERVFPKQDVPTAGKPAKAIRTAGSNAENRGMRLATSVALLIELEAQFYKLVTINHCLVAKLVKWSIRVVKVIFAI